ncbi:CDP-alcohol phosphatidyltransferase family protein [Nocardioides guangzhouensis]|uniref:CDP-alcohol phosphatidyltransferase family protein n=1 Tax=Nocardioides guangzhouensis TaxID=2497878 RepID=A0A4Q4ZKM1_9ACTN|nr:CDP-alcohol phosphatidyltransferase family protein [Nocardioides guangzhouensis]RYP88598.1 CDP-alcohol phosphatidyltransferase family protein [Nocardioides guangzhouensis]
MRRGLAEGAAVLAALLGALAASVGLGPVGWAVGLGCGLVALAAVAGGGAAVLGPADRVTVTRTAIGCAMAALVADAWARPAEVGALVALSTVALVLDAVDGRVARRTGTASGFGARFDGEADAFVMLVLSVYVATTVAGWVLAIGLARYLFGMAGWVVPWFRRTLPRRDWRKVVTAVQGIVLTVAAAAFLPPWLTYAALVAAAALLAESFGRDALWLWFRRHEERATERVTERATERPPSMVLRPQRS